MLAFPAALTADSFLQRYWQKRPLAMPQAAQQSLPTISRNELAWLAMQDDVESRLIFTERNGDSNPLPCRQWPV